MSVCGERAGDEGASGDGDFSSDEELPSADDEEEVPSAGDEAASADGDCSSVEELPSAGDEELASDGGGTAGGEFTADEEAAGDGACERVPSSSSITRAPMPRRDRSRGSDVSELSSAEDEDAEDEDETPFVPFMFGLCVPLPLGC